MLASSTGRKCEDCGTPYADDYITPTETNPPYEKHTWERCAAVLSTQRDEARALVDAATCFRFGDYCAEHVVDVEGKDWGWVVSHKGFWAQSGMTREVAIAEARKKNEERQKMKTGTCGTSCRYGCTTLAEMRADVSDA